MAAGTARRFTWRRWRASSVQIEDREPHAEADRAQRTPEATGRVPSGWRRWPVRFHWAVAALAYAAATLVVTFPLAFHLGDASLAAPVQTDVAWEVWYVWWFHTAINTGQDPAYTHTIYALLPSIEIFPAGYLTAGMAYVFQAMGASPLAAYNVVVLLSFVLTGLTTYLLAGEFVRNRFACFVAGFLYTFCTYHIIRATAHLTLASLEALPLCAWRTFAFYRRPTPLNAVWLGLSVALVCFTDIYYFAYFLVPFALLVGVGKLVTDLGWFKRLRHLLLGGLALLVALLVTVPPLISFVRVDPAMRAALNDYAQQSVVPYSADLLSYVLPMPTNPLFGSLTTPLYAQMHLPTRPAKAVYLGVVALGLGLGAFLFRRNRVRTAAFWLVFGVFTLALSLGPAPRADGRTLASWGLYPLVFGWGPLTAFRTPDRLAPMPMLALCVLAALTVDTLFARFAFDRRTRVALSYLMLVAMAASLVEHLSFGFPIPIVPLHVPALYATIAADRTPGVVLDLPVRQRGVDQFYQTIHGRPLVAGYAIRTTYPETMSIDGVPYVGLFDSYSTQLWTQPAPAQQLAQGDIYAPGESFPQVLGDLGVRYVVLHAGGDLAPAVYTRMRAFLLQQLGAPFYDSRSEGLTAWRISTRAAPAPGAAETHIEYGSGWLPGLRDEGGQLERAVQQDGELLIDAPDDGMQQVSLMALPFFRPLTLVVSLNGTIVQTVQLDHPGRPQIVALGAVRLGRGINTLTIHAVQGCALPGQFDPTNHDSRCFSVGVEQVRIAPAAASVP